MQNFGRFRSFFRFLGFGEPHVCFQVTWGLGESQLTPQWPAQISGLKQSKKLSSLVDDDEKGF
jgi:hypothetical protein